MTDEERRQFIDELRRLGPLFEKSGVADVFIEAANEIERLANELALIRAAGRPARRPRTRRLTNVRDMQMAWHVYN